MRQIFKKCVFHFFRKMKKSEKSEHKEILKSDKNFHFFNQFFIHKLSIFMTPKMDKILSIIKSIKLS